MATTANGLRYPLSTDPVRNGAQRIQELAEDTDAKLALGAYAGYVPTWTAGGAVTTNEALGRYKMLAAKTVLVQVTLAASAPAAAGQWNVSLPPLMIPRVIGTVTMLGHAMLKIAAAGTPWYSGAVRLEGNVATFYPASFSAAKVSTAVAAGDFIAMNLSYELS